MKIYFSPSLIHFNKWNEKEVQNSGRILGQLWTDVWHRKSYPILHYDLWKSGFLKQGIQPFTFQNVCSSMQKVMTDSLKGCHVKRGKWMLCEFEEFFFAYLKGLNGKINSCKNFLSLCSVHKRKLKVFKFLSLL